MMKQMSLAAVIGFQQDSSTYRLSGNKISTQVKHK